MNLKDKLELALHEAYIKAYKLAEPSADFDILVENAEIMSDGKKNIHFENYFLDDDIAENILNEVAKKYKLSKYMKSQLHIAYYLGCSPATKRRKMTINLNDIKLSPVLESVYRSKISDAEYFSSSYSNYISNSRLKYINPDQGGSPSLYNKGIENKSTNSLELGTAIHELFLQPESFKLGDSYNKPTAKLGMVIDSIIKYRKQGYTIRESITKSCIDIDYYKNNLNESRIQNIIKSGLNYYQNCKDLIEGDLVILNDKHRTICSNCLESLSNNPSIVNLVRPEGLEAYNEDALFIDIIGEYNNSKCILKLKMKADNWTIDKDNKIITLNDLKTTGHLLEQFMNGSFWNFHYHRQMGMYLWMLLQFCKKEYGYTPKDWTFQANIIAVETTGSNRASVFNIDSDILNIGRLEFCRLLKMVAYCEINGYSDDVTFI